MPIRSITLSRCLVGSLSILLLTATLTGGAPPRKALEPATDIPISKCLNPVLLIYPTILAMI